MNTKSLRVGTLFTALAAVSSAFAQTSINLLAEDATVRSTGSYTYFARGNGVHSGSSPAYESYTPFTRAFYPGAPHGLNETSAKDGLLTDGGSNIYATNGQAILFTAGDLTNSSTTDSVNGWWGVTQITKTSWTPEGAFDILFDLGAAYNVTKVEIVYTDSGGRRWSTITDIQKVYYAASLAGSAPAESDFSLFGSGTTTSNSTVATLSVDPGASVVARYIDLRLTTQIANSNTGAYGGYLHEVRIYGYAAVPEPAAWSLILGGSILFGGFICRFRHPSEKR